MQTWLRFADFTIWLSHVGIAVVMAGFLRIRHARSLHFMFWLFAGYIFVCGCTHLCRIFSTSTVLLVVNWVCAFVSMMTLLVMIPLVRRVMGTPPTSRRWMEANDALRSKQVEVQRLLNDLANVDPDDAIRRVEAIRASLAREEAALQQAGSAPIVLDPAPPPD